MQMTPHGYPRRSDINALTPAERAIADIMVRIEELGAHPLLTDCISNLDAARQRLADWVELPQSQEHHHEQS